MKPTEKKYPVYNKNFNTHGKKPPTLQNTKIVAKKDFFWLSCSPSGRNGGGSERFYYHVTLHISEW
jgi:hypothetical protein